jgi:hypothetical protein
VEPHFWTSRCGDGFGWCVLDLYGAEHPEGRVSALTLVGDLDVVEDRVGQFDAGVPAATVDRAAAALVTALPPAGETEFVPSAPDEDLPEDLPDEGRTWSSFSSGSRTGRATGSVGDAGRWWGARCKGSRGPSCCCVAWLSSALYLSSPDPEAFGDASVAVEAGGLVDCQVAVGDHEARLSALDHLDGSD